MFSVLIPALAACDHWATVLDWRVLGRWVGRFHAVYPVYRKQLGRQGQSRGYLCPALIHVFSETAPESAVAF